MLDINADCGESFGRWTLGNDAALMQHVTSVNIAAGFHAGDPHTMRQSLRLARQHGVQVGVHPGLPDLTGFGRRAMAVTAEEAADICIYQLGALMAMAKMTGLAVEHLKPTDRSTAWRVKTPTLPWPLARLCAGSVLG